MPVKILLIDDDQVDRQAIRRAIRKSGVDAEISEAVDAVSGKQQLAAALFDCLLLDYRLPDVNGIDLLRELKSGSHSDIPVIMLTGGGDERTAVEAIQAGAHDYLIKDSISPKILEHAIEAALHVMDLEKERSSLAQEREQALNELRDSEERFREAFSTAPNGIALVYPDGNWFAVNSMLQELVGYSEQELMGDGFARVTAPGETAMDIAGLCASAHGDRSRNFQVEQHWQHKEGEMLQVLVGLSFVRDSRGNIQHLVLQTVDLTARREAEAQLRQAQKMEAVGQLTGGVAHDFNNLLTVILGNARLLERQFAGDEATVKKLRAISGAAQRGAELTRRLLAFSRKEAVDPRVVDASDVVREMLDMLSRTLGENIEIQQEVSAESHPIRVDPNQYEGALLNFATNARDAMPEGGKLSIRLRNIEITSPLRTQTGMLPPGRYVTTEVSDTGTGIPEKAIARIFEPFFTTKEVGKGTGLGLSMVFGFIIQSNGHIRVDSVMGRGTTFCIYLPLAETAAQQEDEIPLDIGALKTATGTILVVEDQREVRDVAVFILKERGYDIVEAGSGPEALIQLERQPDIDLLFTDIMMPGGMTGVELAQQVRQRLPGVKLLFTSGYTDDAFSGDSGFTENSVELLRKPYDETELAERISSVMKQRLPAP